MWTEPRERFCRLVVSILHDVIMNSRPGAPIRCAFDGLGERFCELSTAAVSRHARPELARLASLGLSPNEPLPKTYGAAASEIVRRTMLDLIRMWENRRYLLDGEPCDLEDFLRVNVHLSREEVREVRSLRVGDRMVFGGGAFATFILECVAPERAAESTHAA